ncbi:MAG: exodeoxyribonuclease [Frankiales bacterium]|nr:exodeoxyribonuclease [Frankiales bacterium]
MLCVVTANVNGVRAALRRDGLAWLAAVEADVLCLQEVRASEEQLQSVLAEGGLGGYHVAHAASTAAGRAGVAVLTRASHSAQLGLGEFSDQGRWAEVELQTEHGPLTVVSAYVHTGEAETERQLEKYRFLDAMSQRMAELSARAEAGGGEAIITGDLNVAHREADLKNWKGNRKKSGFLLPERAYLDRWLASGWTDLGRHHAGDGPGPYTWWSWRGKAFDLDSGWRIDYVLTTRGLTARSVKAEVGRAATYAQRWSDHAPVTAWFS